MYTIFKLTVREHLHRKILFFSLILAIVFLGLYGVGIHYAAKSLSTHPDPMISYLVLPQLLSIGLYFGGFIVSFLAIFSSAGSISSEIENGIIQTVIVKPIRRYEIVLGKFLGTGFFLMVYAVLFYTAIYLLVHLQSGIKLSGFGNSMALFALQPMILLAVSLLGSTLLPTMANGVLAFAIYFIGIIGGIVEQIAWLINSAVMQKIGIVASLIMPTDSMYRKIVSLLLKPSENPSLAIQQMGPFGSMMEPSIWMVMYAVLYVLVLTAIAVYSFNKKDI